MLNKILMGVVIALLIVAFIPPILTHVHEYEWTVVNEPTCLDVGVTTGICKCGKKVTKTISMLAHQYSDWRVSLPATCTKEGFQIATCTLCGQSTHEILKPLGHDMGEWNTYENPTCSQEGKQQRECETCGFKQYQSIEKIPHQYSDWTDLVVATCTNNGLQTRSCTGCGKEESRVVFVNHEFINRQPCTMCGIEYFTQSLDFTYDASLFGFVVSVGNCTELDVVIPSKYDGRNVVAIGYEGFQRSNITKVTIPESVTTIGGLAFDSCIYLEEVVFAGESQLTTIGSAAFRACSSLTSITLPQTVSTVGSELFRDCKKLQQFTIPQSLTTVEHSMFLDCINLQTITIHAGVTSIDDYAFSFCQSLKDVIFEQDSQLHTICQKAFFNTGISEITIPASVARIEMFAFSNCPQLKSIYFEEPTNWFIKIEGSYRFFDLSTPSKNIIYFTNTYVSYVWLR